MNFYFNSKESYNHLYAKLILKEWLKFDYIIYLEQKFYLNNKILFIPDLTCYKNGEINKIIEIVNKSDLTGEKLNKIQKYQYYTKSRFKVFSITSEYILRQVNKPDDIKMINFS